MELYKKIETYLGRVIDFENEIILENVNHFKDNEVGYDDFADGAAEKKVRIEKVFSHYEERIKSWNAPENKPTDAELEAITEYRNPRQAEIVRAERDRLISETDWTQNSDVNLSDEKKEAYIIYRQKLRDISKQSGFPYDVIFPDKP